MRIKMAGLAAAVTVLTGGVLVTGAGAADAAAPAAQQLRVVQTTAGNYTDLVIYNFNGQEMGMGQWSQDPQDGNPGDALRAYDGLADGYAIYAYLSDGRVATTSGHNSPYWSGWVGPNLPEDHTYTMTVWIRRTASRTVASTRPSHPDVRTCWRRPPSRSAPTAVFAAEPIASRCSPAQAPTLQGLPRTDAKAGASSAAALSQR
ncbi:hypothetical protein OG900_38560 [Streptomyces sp. NBC_00433]